MESALSEAFALVIAGLAPLLLAVAASGVAVGLLAGGLGLRDGALNQVVRSLAVILALAVVGGELADSLVDFAGRSWSLADTEAAQER